MTSYELSNMILQLREQQEEGLIDIDTFNDTVEGLCVEDKLNGLIYANKRVSSEIELLKEEKKRLDKEIKKQEKNQERLRELVNMLLKATGQKKFEGTAGKISYRKSSSIETVEGLGEMYKDEVFVTKEINYKVDKKELNKFIDFYGEIYGTKVITKENLQIK